jgi:ADP-heptose:LPS heptosyltransferase
MVCVSPEPYRVWEYYNQKASLAQAYDIAINNKGIRDLPKPTIKLSKQETLTGLQVCNEVKEKTKKKKTIVFQPFGRGVVEDKGVITDFSGRSFEATTVVNLVKELAKDYAIIFMGEVAIEFSKHGVTESVAIPQNINLRQWASIIANADHFLGCDSVGQHLAYSLGTSATVVIGSTFKENVSYPNEKTFNILDMGEGARVYSPIRITIDEFSDRVNEGVMQMNDKVEEVIVKEIKTSLKGTK